MSRFILAAFMALLILSCSSPVEVETPSPEVTIDDEEMLLGVITREDFQLTNYQKWFDSTYAAYVPSDSVLNILAQTIDDIHIDIYMATWCSDSRRDVPALMRILDDLKYDQGKIRIIATDRSKTLPESEMEGMNIEFVPTFVFKRDSTEIGRIVEFPMLTLEQDLLDILES